MSYPTQDDLRLEVETDPAGLTNLIQNPSGELGGYAWVTPVAGSNLTGGTELTFTAPSPAAASYFYSEPLAVAAGEYVAASWVASFALSYYRAKVEWLDASFAVLSSATQTGYLVTSASTQYYGPYLAPASTAYARLRFDLYSTNAGANPVAGATMRVKQVTVAKAATSGALGTIRTNLVNNPSFETNTTGWTASAGDSLTRITTQFNTGTAAAKVMATSAGTIATMYTGGGLSGIPVTPGATYAFSYYFKSNVSTRKTYLYATWYDASGAYISDSSTTTLSATTSWARWSRTNTAPANAAFVRINIYLWASSGNLALTDELYVDSVMMEQAAAVGSYFDGSTAAGGGVTYGWTGTAHASKSTATTSNLAYIEPTAYLDILGPTHDIKVVREELNIGALDATILDATIDPSQGSLIRPGRKLRLSVLKSGVWEPLFTGKVSSASVKYDLKANTGRQARITLSAIDNVGTLGSTSRPVGVGTIDELPYVLEGAGVPWVVNGNSNQVATATVASKNDSASALDQVAITRDSKLGFAWVDRNNTLRAYDANKMPSKNLLPNPNFAVDASGWNADTLCTITRLASLSKVSGNPILKMTSTGAGAMRAATTGGPGGVVVTPALPVTASVDFYVDPSSGVTTNPISTSVSVRWYNAAGTLLSTSTSSVLAATSGVWRSVSAGFTAPASAAFASLVVNATALGSGNTLYLRNASLATEAFITLDETIYSDLDVDYSTERCINEVVVKYLRYNVGSGETTEIAYGPYRNAGSIAIWGVRSAEFTVHGITESTSNIQAYAEAILAANGSPTIRTNGVTVPIVDSNDLPYALADLYSPVITTNAAKNLADFSRVSGIEHSIEPGKWLTKLVFTDTGSVASPQVTPPVQSTATGPPHSDRYQSSALSIPTGTTFTQLTMGSNTETTGIGFSGGTWTVQRAGRYLITCTIAWNGNATGRRMIRNLINGTEANRVENNPDDTNNFTQTLTRVQRLTVGDLIAFDVIQTSGAALNVNAGPSQTQAQITWLGD